MRDTHTRWPCSGGWRQAGSDQATPFRWILRSGRDRSRVASHWCAKLRNAAEWCMMVLHAGRRACERYSARTWVRGAPTRRPGCGQRFPTQAPTRGAHGRHRCGAPRVKRLNWGQDSTGAERVAHGNLYLWGKHGPGERERRTVRHVGGEDLCLLQARAEAGRWRRGCSCCAEGGTGASAAAKTPFWRRCCPS